MINTDNYKSTYTTVADQTTWYPVTFQYDSPDNTPELLVTVNGDVQNYGDDYIVGVGGVQLTYEPDAGLELVICRNVPLTQEIDFQIGIIDPEQIEHGFDRSVMRDQELMGAISASEGDISELKNDIDDLKAEDIILQNNIDGKVSKSGDTMSGALKFTNGNSAQDSGIEQSANASALRFRNSNNSMIMDFALTGGLYPSGNGLMNLGTGASKWNRVYANKLNNGSDIEIPTTAGTIARIEDLPTTAADVHALPDTTKYASSISLTIDQSTFVVSAQLKDQDGNNIGAVQTIDLPLESVVVSGSYDSVTKEVVLTLQGGSTIRFSVADLVSGLQTEITSLNMLDADLVDDSTSTNKFVTASEKSAIATAVQPGDLATVATTGDYDDLLNKPDALENEATGNDSLTICGTAATDIRSVNIGFGSVASGMESTSLGWMSGASARGAVAVGGGAKSYSADSISIGNYASTNASNAIQLNASGVLVVNNDQNTVKVANTNGNFEIMSADGTIPEDRLADTTNAQQGDVLTLDAYGDAVWQAGSGAVDSVNGKTGVVVLNASDVGALPSTTKYGASLSLSINSTTYVLTAQLKDQDNNNLGAAQTIDLPLESVVVSGAYDSVTKEVVLTLQGGSTIRFSVADLVSGLQTEITSLNMLDADLVDDSTSTNKFVTTAEKSAIATAVQPGDLATVATSGDYDDLLNKPTIPDTTHMVTDNTAQSISAVKTFTAANPDATTAQTIVANYAVKFGTSGNDDLFAISANTGTSTLSIVGDNASNIIDIAASGAVLNHFQVTSSDVTFGGNSLINPGVMTGADGVNAGTSGLVPAPAATDDDKFLCGDGTWKAAGGGGLPSQTGNAGKFLTTDGTDASWSDTPLVNSASSGNSLSISGNGSTVPMAVNVGRGAKVSQSNGVAVGAGADVRGAGGVAIGMQAYVTNGNNGGVAIGKSAFVGAANAIQLDASNSNSYQQNNDANTFKVANANGNFEIMSADGTVPTARLTKVNTTVTLASADWSSNTQTVSVTGMTATGVVFVNPDPSDQADYTSAGILCTAQAAGTLTFTCDTAPSNDIDVVVVMM